jgi:hypothetical protein
MAADHGPNEKFCFECASAIRVNAEICPKCGVRQPTFGAPVYGSAVGFNGAPSQLTPEDFVINRIASSEKISAIVWLIIGILQVLFLVTIIAGIWNVIAALMMFKRVDRIRQRDAGVPAEFEPAGGLIIIGLVNLFFGAVFGALWVVYDFHVRGEVLRHRHLFERTVLPTEMPRLQGWTVRTPVGEYPAKDLAMVQDWLREGRLGPKDFVYSPDAGRWRTAGEIATS